MSIPILPIGGTWSWGGWTTKGQWWQPGSTLLQQLASDGLVHIAPERPFVWTTSLNGTVFGHEKDWDAGGAALNTYFRPIHDTEDHPYVPIVERNVIGHSHAIGVIAYALACYGLRLHCVVTLGSPIRREIEDLLRTRGLRNVDAWLHVWAPGDPWQARGGWFDRRFGVRRKLELGGVTNVEIPRDFSHSGLLKPENYWAWRTYGLTRWLQSAADIAVRPPITRTMFPVPKGVVWP